MRKRPHAVETNGLPVLSLPVTRRNRVNEKQKAKMVTKSERRVTVSRLLGMAGIYPDAPMLFCGSHSKALPVLQELVNAGNTVVVIEHNLDVIKRADHIIDLGPEGGSAGGQIVAEGTPEEVAANPASFTGQYLGPILQRDRVKSGETGQE